MSRLNRKTHNYKSSKDTSSSSGSSNEGGREVEPEEDYYYDDPEIAAARTEGRVYWDPNSPSPNSSRYESRTHKVRPLPQQTSPSIILGEKRAPPPKIPLTSMRPRTPKKPFVRTGSMEELKNAMSLAFDKKNPILTKKSSAAGNATSTTTTTIRNSTATASKLNGSDNLTPTSVAEPESRSATVSSNSCGSCTGSGSYSVSTLDTVGEVSDDDFDADFDEELFVQIELTQAAKQDSASTTSSDGHNPETKVGCKRSNSDSGYDEGECKNQGKGNFSNSGKSSNHTSSNASDNDSNNNNSTIFEQSTCLDIKNTPSQPKYRRVEPNEPTTISKAKKKSDMEVRRSDSGIIGFHTSNLDDFNMDDEDDSFLGALEI